MQTTVTATIITRGLEQRRLQAPSQTYLDPAGTPLSATIPVCATTSKGVSIEQNNVNENLDAEEVVETSLVQTRPKRSTAGQHPNPFGLPRSAGHMFSTAASNLQLSNTSNNQVAQNVFRPSL